MSKAGWSGRYFSFSSGGPQEPIKVNQPDASEVGDQVIIRGYPDWVGAGLRNALDQIDKDYTDVKSCKSCMWFFTNSTEKFKKHNEEYHGDPDWNNKADHPTGGPSYTSPYLQPNAFAKALRRWPNRPRQYPGTIAPRAPVSSRQAISVENWDGVEIIRGYRAYSITFDDYVPVLMGFNQHVWRDKELIAECGGSRIVAENHLSTGVCSCGIYLLKERSYNPYMMGAYPALVQCLVGGNVVEADLGYRASLVRMEKIWVSENSQNLIKALTDRYGIPVEHQK